MPFENLILLAPCHGLEDFPLYHTGDDAASLLACWTSLWHPTLLHHAKRLPRVERCDYPPDDLSSALLVLPKPCESELSETLPGEVEAVGSCLIRDSSGDRGAILATALESYTVDVDQDLVLDFLALGFTLLQVELLTQQMRYSSAIDPSRIERLVFEAAQLGCAGETEASREKLVLAHDALADERNHYYPVDVFLIDLTLLSETTLGGSLGCALDDPTPWNVVSSGATLDVLDGQQPETCARMKEAVANGQLGIAGGEYDERPLPLMTIDAALRNVQRGFASWQRVLGMTPRVFARRRSGLYPSLASGLQTAGFKAALHMRFDEGRYPESSQSKSGWLTDSAQDASALPMLGRQPLNANAHQTFLELPRELSDSMDTDFVAVRVFWHWLGHTVPWYDDLRRACRLGSAIGKFVTLEEFFVSSADSTATDDFSASSYRYPYLAQASKRNRESPQRVWMDYWQQTVQTHMLRGAQTLACALGADSQLADGPLRALQQSVDGLPESEQSAGQGGGKSTGQGVVADVAAVRRRLQEVLAERLVAEGATDTGKTGSKTIVNPLPFARRILLEGDVLSGPCQGSAVYASSSEGQAQRTLVDVPGMGFATVDCRQAAKELSGPFLADGVTLQNEFLYATIDEVTGALRSFRIHGSRTTRVSHQVALRITLPKTGQHWIDRQSPVSYSVMAADEVNITANGKLFAEITASGRMLAPSGDVVGQFSQRFQVTRGSRILTIVLDVVPQQELLLSDDPWNSYYASRLAFGDETAVLVAGRHFQAVEVSSRRLEAPLFVDIDSPGSHTTLFTSGLPFHRRVSPNQLDTLLVTGQSQDSASEDGDDGTGGGDVGSRRTFRLGIGVDVPHPVTAAWDWMAQATEPWVLDGPASSAAGWLFHVTAKNVFISSWEPMPEGTWAMQLIETEGRRTKCQLHAFRPWKSLQQVTLDDEALDSLTIEDGVALLSLAPFQTIRLRGRL